MKTELNKIIILGAGPAGLSCAFELAKKRNNLIVVEKDQQVGGLAQTLEFTDNNLLYRTDIGPHRFFSKNKYLYNLIADLLGDDWLLINRKTRQYIAGKFYDYPVNAIQAFINIGPIKGITIIFSYLKAFIQYKIFQKPIKSFADYIIANFGLKLGELNMLNYTEKIWGIPCQQIHPDWAKQRIKGLNLLSALKNALFSAIGGSALGGKKNNGPKTLIDSFYYPKYGTGQIYQAMAKKILEQDNKIFTQSYPTKIEHNGNNKITAVTLNINGQNKTISPEYLISSIPINQFIKLLNPAPPAEITKTIENLKWRAQVYLFITVNKPQITTDNWIYIPDQNIPFARLAEMKNFSQHMAPKNKTSLLIEYFVNTNDKIWNMPAKELFELTIENLAKLNLLTASEVDNYHLLKRKYVYPVYDLAYPANIKIIKEYLNQFNNLYYLGRPGRFQYTNQDHSLEMGILTAKNILENKKYDLDLVGSENEYFEKGNIG
jgi:protoporphyrinogen oxidase